VAVQNKHAVSNTLQKTPQWGESVILPPVELLAQTINVVLEQVIEKTRAHKGVSEELHLLQGAVRWIEQLLSFAGPPGSKLTRKELIAGISELLKLVPRAEAMATYYTAGEARRGRQVERRYVAAAALEAKRKNPKLTRRELAEMFCPCSKQNHDSVCVERLRRDILRLKALVRPLENFLPKQPQS
jgi:hypothetical protein